MEQRSLALQKGLKMLTLNEGLNIFADYWNMEEINQKADNTQVSRLPNRLNPLAGGLPGMEQIELKNLLRRGCVGACR